MFEFDSLISKIETVLKMSIFDLEEALIEHATGEKVVISDEGVTYRGKLYTHNDQVHTYDDWYYDSNNFISFYDDFYDDFVVRLIKLKGTTHSIPFTDNLKDRGDGRDGKGSCMAGSLIIFSYVVNNNKFLLEVIGIDSDFFLLPLITSLKLFYSNAVEVLTKEQYDCNHSCSVKSGGLLEGNNNLVITAMQKDFSETKIVFEDMIKSLEDYKPYISKIVFEMYPNNTSGIKVHFNTNFFSRLCISAKIFYTDFSSKIQSDQYGSFLKDTVSIVTNLIPKSLFWKK